MYPVMLELLLLLGLAQQTPAADTVPPSPAGPTGIQRIGRDVAAPVPIYRPDPAYSVQASKGKCQGTVIVALVVDETGAARDIRVVKPLGMGLDEKAVEAVGTWRFRPGMKDGHPVKVMAQIEVNFRLLVFGWNMWGLNFERAPGVSLPALQATHFDAPRSRLPGRVSLAFDLDETGRPENVRVVRSSDDSLNKSAVSSLRKWRFDPATRDGQPVSTSGTIELTFRP